MKNYYLALMVSALLTLNIYADENETMTEGYKMLNLKLVKDYQIGKANLRVAAFANNALDQVARNSTSFVKDAVPLPGRNVGLSIKLTY